MRRILRLPCMTLVLMGCLIVMCSGLGINAEAWQAPICLTAGSLIDRVYLVIEPFDDLYPERTLYQVHGIWYAFSLYEIHLVGTGVYTAHDWWINASLHGVHTSTAFGANSNCTFAFKGPFVSATWKIHCSGTASPFQVSGTFPESGIGVYAECGDYAPWGHAPLTGIASSAPMSQQESLQQAVPSFEGAAGDAKNNELK